MPMLRLLAPQGKSRSDRGVIDLPEAPRPCTATQVEDRKSMMIASAPRPTSSSLHVRPNRHSAAMQTWSNDLAHRDHHIPRLTRTPWELERHKKNSVWRRTKTEHQFPAHVFKNLPREVYDCIVEQLEQIHLGNDQSCPSCYLKDLYSLLLTSRAWDRAAIAQMYRKVYLPTHDDHSKLPKLKIPGTSRLKLLRRTLRERPVLARQVKEIHMPDFQALHQHASIEREEIANLVASLVMACPNLERLVGFHLPFAHSYDRLSHALSTRSNLKERVWFFSDNSDLEIEDDEDDTTRGYYHSACDPTERFLELNSNHLTLQTLVLHQDNSTEQVPLTFRSIIGTMRQFPVLRNLSISGLPAASFTNLALNALPANLQSLRLEDLPGINDKGLQKFTASQAATSLESLVLVNLEITSLNTISNILSTRFSKLTRFSISQHKAPFMPSTASIPDLCSQTLKFIHWELRSQAGPTPSLFPSALSMPDSPSFPLPDSEPLSCLATYLLATSIQRNLFPSLRQIRAPHDPQGLLQALCKPLATALFPSDASSLASARRASSSTFHSLISNMDGYSPTFKASEYAIGVPQSPRADSAMSLALSTDSTQKNCSPNSVHFDTPLLTTLTPVRSRVAAQSRILAARKLPHIGVKIFDPEGTLRVDKTTSAFVGQLGSNIVYNLRPDRSRAPSSNGDNLDEDQTMHQWITGISDVLGHWEVAAPSFCGHCHRLINGSAGKKAVSVDEMF